MRFTVLAEDDCQGDCFGAIVAQGEITNSTYRALSAAVRRAPGAPILLQSPGGTLVGGLMLGQEIRRLGVRVVVPPGAVCASACAYAFLGGARREVMPAGRLGVHNYAFPTWVVKRMSKTERASNDREARALLLSYVRAMGISSDIVSVSLKTSNSSIHFLTPNEMRRMRVVTGGGKARRSTRMASR